MGDGVTSAGNAPPANQTTNAGQSGAQSQADAQSALFGEALKQENLCPEGLHRPHRNEGMSRSLLNIEKRSLLRSMLSGVGLANKDAV